MKRPAWFALFLLASFAFPLAPFALADGTIAPLRRIDMNTAFDSGTPDATKTSKGAPISHIPPDPSPLFERGQWVFDLRYDKGDLSLLGVHHVDLPAAQHTPRAMGRFAVELFEGPVLIERVRFDFPLLGAGEDLSGGFNAPASFERGLNTRIGVMFPATRRGTRAELWDRATNKRWSLPWPPADTRPPPTTTAFPTSSTADAGSPR